MTPDELISIDKSRRQSDWPIAEGVAYLNHGSFGPSSTCVLEERERWSRQLESQPMAFFVRQLEDELERAAEIVGRFVGCHGDDLIFVPNATHGMNIAAANVRLSDGDEVLLTDHEYGPVRRLWGRRCTQAGAKTTLASLPTDWDDDDQLVDALFDRVTDRTRVIVVSQVTSQTALVFPIADICRRARERDILTVIDGPHAVAMLPLNIEAIGCDFYTACGHKWLSAPFGSGFLYVRREHQRKLKPVVTSWGRSLSGRAPSWRDEFHWPGTFDPTPYLAMPRAIAFLEQAGLDTFRNDCALLVDHAEEQLHPLGAVPITRRRHRAPTMTSLHLPRVSRSDAWPGKPHPLQLHLADAHIETPVFEWHDRLYLRVSCHLYNTPSDIERLTESLGEYLTIADC